MVSVYRQRMAILFNNHHLFSLKRGIFSETPRSLLEKHIHEPRSTTPFPELLSVLLLIPILPNIP